MASGLVIGILLTFVALTSAQPQFFASWLRQHESRFVGGNLEPADAPSPRPSLLPGMQASLSSEGLNYVKAVLVQQVRLPPGQQRG